MTQLDDHAAQQPHTARPTSEVLLEGELWHPGRAWQLALEHLANRMRRVRQLDLGQMRAAGLPDTAAAAPVAAAVRHDVEALAAWAGHDIDWRRELARWLDEHLSMHVRPDPTQSRRLRALATDHDVVVRTSLPPAAAESLLRHLGAWRSVARLAPAAEAPDSN